MKKTCSIRLLIGAILLTTALAGSVGYFAGTIQKWNAYEKRIALLEDRVSEVKESLNVAEPYAYVLMEEQGYVTVYHADRKTLYATTDIRVMELPETLQEELKEGKYIESEEQLYNFLENYSS